MTSYAPRQIKGVSSTCQCGHVILDHEDGFGWPLFGWRSGKCMECLCPKLKRSRT